MIELAWREFQEASTCDDRLRTWHAIHSILTAGACISRILWPGEKGSKRHRGWEATRQKLLAQLAPRLAKSLRDRTVRDHFEHFDERLHKWARQSVPAYSDRDLVPSGQPWAEITAVTRADGSRVKVPKFRRLRDHTVSFDDDKVDLKAVVEAARELRNSIQAQPGAATWPPGFLDRTFGCLRDDPIERPEQLPLESREPLN